MTDKRVIPTDAPGLSLVELGADDADELYRLVDRNRDHLTQHGDYKDLGSATLESIIASLTDLTDRNDKYGIWLDGRMIGRVDLSPRGEKHYVVGYWLGREFTGCGYATYACRALLEHAFRDRAAIAIYAGVTKGNAKSEALLLRLGFEPIEDRNAYTLFRRSADASH